MAWMPEDDDRMITDCKKFNRWIETFNRRPSCGSLVFVTVQRSPLRHLMGGFPGEAVAQGSVPIQLASMVLGARVHVRPAI